MLKAGEGHREWLIAAGSIEAIPVIEYSPKKVKKSITGMEMLPKSRWQHVADFGFILKNCLLTWMLLMVLR